MVKAAELLAAEGMEVTVLSVTSWSELARNGQACERRALAGEAEPGVPWLAQQLEATSGPVIAATDYVRAVPESVRAWVPTGRRKRGTEDVLRPLTPEHADDETFPGLLIVRPEGRLFFVNAQNVARAARQAVG